MASNIIKLKKKGEISMIWKKPLDGVLNKDLIKILSEDDEGIHIEFIEDTFVMGKKSRRKTFYIVNEVKAAKGYTKATSAVTPWRELSDKLKEDGVEAIETICKIAPIHYKDEYAIPYDTDSRNGKFFIIKKDDVMKYVHRLPTKFRRAKDNLAYFGTEDNCETPTQRTKMITDEAAISIGFHIENNLHLNEDVDKLTLEFILKDTSQKCKFDFEVKNPLIDLYRFLIVFDGDEYSKEITKEEIVGSNQIRIKTYKTNKTVDEYVFNTKSIIGEN